MSFSIITESSCDLSKYRAEALSVKVLPFSVSVDGKEPMPETALDIKNFYADLRGGSTAKTSALNIAEYEESFEEELKKGKDVLHIGLSSGLSASFGCAVLAAEELSKKYPDRVIINIDSIGGSLGQGMLVQFCAMRRDAGESIQSVASFAESIKGKIVHRFTVGDLKFLKNGGRISPTVAVVGSMLNIKPILSATDVGKLSLSQKVRGRTAAIEKLFSDYKNGQDPDFSDAPVFISHGDCETDARALEKMIIEDDKTKNVYINDIGALMGAHAGPDTVAIFYVGRER